MYLSNNPIKTVNIRENQPWYLYEKQCILYHQLAFPNQIVCKSFAMFGDANNCTYLFNN